MDLVHALPGTVVEVQRHVERRAAKGEGLRAFRYVHGDTREKTPELGQTLHQPARGESGDHRKLQHATATLAAHERERLRLHFIETGSDRSGVPQPRVCMRGLLLLAAGQCQTATLGWLFHGCKPALQWWEHPPESSGHPSL